MGWLRELMASADPRITSYGELSRLCLGHGEWPAGIQPKPRSLAALFSKFDRLIELDWLADRSQAQVVLSRVLNCPLGLIKLELEKSLRGADEALLRWRLKDAPLARPLDLLEEPLPPGIPEIVARPVEWDATWWRADSGNGVPLVRHWLHARGMACVVEARTWADAASRLMPGHATFVELQSAEGSIVPPAGLRICVACPGQAPAGWQEVCSPEVREYVDLLLAWLAERLPRDGHFELDEAQKWFTAAVSGGLVDCLQTAIGLAGLLDEIGVSKLRGRPIHRLAEDFMDRRLTEAGMSGRAEAQWLKQHGFQVLVGMAKRALTESRWPWDTARSQDEWMKLVPSEFQRSVDAEWASLSLARAGAKLTVGELERALADTPPGAFRVVRALMSTRLLESDGGGLFRMGPRWLVQSARARAEEYLLADSPFEWGEALLRRHARERVLELLFFRANQGNPQLLEQVIELDDDENPAFILALESLVLAVGCACLRGVEYEPMLLSCVLELQRGYALTFDETVAPRILCDTQNSQVYGQWLIALWAIAELCDELEQQCPALINPWDSPPPPEVLLAALNAIQLALGSANQDSDWAWVKNAVLLLGRLASSMIEESEDDRKAEADWAGHPLILATRINRASSLAEWKSLASSPVALRTAWETRADWSETAGCAFSTWESAGEICLGFLAPDAPLAEALWPYVPPKFLSKLVDAQPALLGSVPTRFISEQAWKGVLDRTYPPQEEQSSTGKTGRRLEERLCHALPLSLVRQALAGAANYGDVEVLTLLWQRAPESVLADALTYADSREWSLALPLFETIPISLQQSLIAALRERVEKLGVAHPICDFSRRWLHRVVCGKQGRFREAYALLAEIERRRNRALAARGQSSRPHS